MIKRYLDRIGVFMIFSGDFDLIKKFDKSLEELSENLNDEEKKLIGMCESDGIESRILNNMNWKSVNGDNVDVDTIPGAQGKRSDAEIIFQFAPEDIVKAKALYDFAVFDLGLMPGEVILNRGTYDSGGVSSVHFAPHVCAMKPFAMKGVMKAYDELDRFDDYYDGTAEVSDEDVNTVADFLNHRTEEAIANKTGIPGVR